MSKSIPTHWEVVIPCETKQKALETQTMVREGGGYQNAEIREVAD